MVFAADPLTLAQLPSDMLMLTFKVSSLLFLSRPFDSSKLGCGSDLGMASSIPHGIRLIHGFQSNPEQFITRLTCSCGPDRRRTTGGTCVCAASRHANRANHV